jgi:methyl-accepting chemotaxis protein
MKLKVKLSIIMVAIVTVIVISIAVMQLRQASDISLNMSKRSATYLARQRAQYRNRRIGGYIQVLHTLSNVMSYYENINAAGLRPRYEETIRSVFESQPDFNRMFTSWKPKALDGMDSRYVGRTGSVPTGQYAPTS